MQKKYWQTFVSHSNSFQYFLCPLAGSKLRRLRSAIDANIITIPYPNEYQDAHTIASVLKSYLRDLPEPLLTYELFDQFISASQRPTDEQRKIAILNVIKQLPKSNYENLRYLSKFLGEFLFELLCFLALANNFVQFQSSYRKKVLQIK